MTTEDLMRYFVGREELKRMPENMGCKVEDTTNEGNDTPLDFIFEGGQFRIFMQNMAALTYYPYWLQIKADEPDLPLIWEAINQENCHYNYKTVLSDIDDKGYRYLSTQSWASMSQIKLHQERFLKVMLEGFFSAQRDFYRHFDEIKKKRQEAEGDPGDYFPSSTVAS